MHVALITNVVRQSVPAVCLTSCVLRPVALAVSVCQVCLPFIRQHGSAVCRDDDGGGGCML